MTRKPILLRQILVYTSMFAFIFTCSAPSSQASFIGQMFNSVLQLCGDGGGNSGPTSKGCWPTENGTSTNNGTLAATSIVILGATSIVGTTVLLVKLINRKHAQIEDYIDKNKTFLLADIARGNGEYLRGYANLFGCTKPDSVRQFSLLARDGLNVMDLENVDGKKLNAQIIRALEDKPDVWRNCDV